MMALTGSAAAVKYLLFFFNLLFVITGIIILTVGTTVQAVYHGFSEFLDSQYHTLPAFLVFIGIIIFTIAFFGCCGALKENYCMLLTFYISLILVCIFELSAGISGYILRNRTGAVLRDHLDTTMKLYGDPGSSDTTQLWDTVQKDFACCGLWNVKDWQLARNGSIPMSCCLRVPGAMNNETCSAKKAFPNGCLEEFGSFIKSNAVTLGSVGIGIAVVQFLGIFLACYIARRIRNHNYPACLSGNTSKLK